VTETKSPVGATLSRLNILTSGIVFGTSRNPKPMLEPQRCL
jgi:hypothetical protein